jgi:hypothetical protein
MNKYIVGIILIVIAAIGIYAFTQSKPETVEVPETPSEPVATSTMPTTGTSTPSSMQTPGEEVIGKSAQGRNITAYHYGTGSDEILFIGGIHGGYEWNTALVAYQAMDYFDANPSSIPSNLRITVIPALNPDGVFKVTGKEGRFAAADVSSSQDTQIAGRFNGNTVDLNRNFDCDWQAKGKWQTREVSGGTAAFSEPESQAIKNYVSNSQPKAVITWYSAAGGVFASSCHNGVSPETNSLTKTFAEASGYKAYQDFNFYEITGDMVNWFAKQSIPAISVLLTDHTSTEWNKNKAGIDAVLKHYAAN